MSSFLYPVSVFCEHVYERGGGDQGRHMQMEGKFGVGHGAKTELVPLVELPAELVKGSARIKRSGSSREGSGDFSPSISFSVSEPEREDGERLAATDGNTEEIKAVRGGWSKQVKKKRGAENEGHIKPWKCRKVFHILET